MRRVRGRQWNFVRPGHTIHVDIIFRRAVTNEAVVGAVQQLLGDETVEAADNNGETLALGGEVAFDDGHLKKVRFVKYSDCTKSHLQSALSYCNIKTLFAFVNGYSFP